jgi:hypothetical protein
MCTWVIDINAEMKSESYNLYILEFKLIEVNSHKTSNQDILQLQDEVGKIFEMGLILLTFQ